MQICYGTQLWIHYAYNMVGYYINPRLHICPPKLGILEHDSFNKFPNLVITDFGPKSRNSQFGQCIFPIWARYMRLLLAKLEISWPNWGLADQIGNSQLGSACSLQNWQNSQFGHNFYKCDSLKKRHEKTYMQPWLDGSHCIIVYNIT